MPGGDRCLSGRTGGAGSGHTASPHTFAAQVPLGLLATSPALPGAPVSTDLRPAWRPGELSVTFAGAPAQSPALCWRAGVGVRLRRTLPAPSHPGESPAGAEVPLGEGDRRPRLRGESWAGCFFFLLRVALLDQKLKAVNIFLSCMPPSCWPAKLVS